MRKGTANNLIRVTLAVLTLVACLTAFCACHVFPWYAPKPYNDEQMAKIYNRLKGELDGLEHFSATVGRKQDGLSYYYGIFSDEGKLIIRYDAYAEAKTVKRGLWYEGTLKEWDVESRSETETSKDASDYAFLLERVRLTADFFKTKVLGVMAYSSDSYCWQCFPWNVGMAQMYYLPDDGSEISASWTIEENYDSDKFPLICEAEYHYDTQDDSVWLTVYDSPYGIDERIANIIDGYGQDKQLDEKMLYKLIYIKGFEETLTLELYNNESARALLDAVSQGDVTITVDDYGGFEKTGALGFTLPANDERQTAEYGDVMLYGGNQVSIFYGQNAWDYTPLGFIAGYSETAFKEVIEAGKGVIQITLSLNRD